MKNCKNCNSLIRYGDKYCRTCGIKLPSRLYIIVCNIYSVLLMTAIIGFIILVVASYLID